MELIEAVNINKSKKFFARDMLSKRDLDLIVEFYQADFQAFGYSYEI